jgi:hypothetical protein
MAFQSKFSLKLKNYKVKVVDLNHIINIVDKQSTLKELVARIGYKLKTKPDGSNKV